MKSFYDMCQLLEIAIPLKNKPWGSDPRHERIAKQQTHQAMQAHEKPWYMTPLPGALENIERGIKENKYKLKLRFIYKNVIQDESLLIKAMTDAMQEVGQDVEGMVDRAVAALWGRLDQEGQIPEDHPFGDTLPFE